MLQRIREGWPKQESLNCKDAEADEVNIGGENPNRHFDKRFGNNRPKGVSIAAVMYDRETGRVAAEVILEKTEETLSAFVKKHLRRGAPFSPTSCPATPVSAGRQDTKPSATERGIRQGRDALRCLLPCLPITGRRIFQNGQQDDIPLSAVS